MRKTPGNQFPKNNQVLYLDKELLCRDNQALCRDKVPDYFSTPSNPGWGCPEIACLWETLTEFSWLLRTLSPQFRFAPLGVISFAGNASGVSSLHRYFASECEQRCGTNSYLLSPDS
jgi:hypothetical protein